MDELSAVASSKALKIANEKKTDGHFNYTSETNGKSYTVYEDVMDEGNVYNITHVEEIKPDVEAEVNERIKKSNNGLLVNDSEYGQRNIDRDTKSSRYRGTSESVSELFETESEQPRGKGSEQVDKNSTKNIRKELDNSSFSLDEKAPVRKVENDKTDYSLSDNTSRFKQKQLDIINNSNPAPDDNHTWIRSTDDIKTFNEAFFEDGEYSGMDPDFTEDMAQKSIDSGKITIFN